MASIASTGGRALKPKFRFRNWLLPRSIRARWRWHSPELIVADRALALGSQTAITYRRKPRRVTDIGTCGIRAQLLCEESATYSRGTDSTTVTATVYQQSHTGEGAGTAEGLEATVVVPIPVYAGAPTQSFEHNQISWFLEIEVRGDRLPTDVHRFEIAVSAQLDERLGQPAPVQDTW